MHLVPLKQTSYIQMRVHWDKYLLEKKLWTQTAGILPRTSCTSDHFHEHKMRKHKNDPWITMANIFPILDRTTKGVGAAPSLGYHYMPHREKVPSMLNCFLGKHQSISKLLHPIPNIISAPNPVYTVASPCSPPLFCSQSGSCLGPLGQGSYQLVMGPGGSGPRPWTQTDWLASYLHSGLCVPFPPLHAAVFSEFGQTGKNAAREQIWAKYTHKHT